MASAPLPDGLSDRNSRRGRAARHANLVSLLLLGGILLAALLGVFGGDRSELRSAAAPEARLTVHTPTTLRSGLFFETRITVTARRNLDDAVIAIPPDLWRDMTINTVEPVPGEESYSDGALRFAYGPLAANEVLRIKIDGQINPPLVFGNSGEIALYDGDRRIAAIPIQITVLP